MFNVSVLFCHVVRTLTFDLPVTKVLGMSVMWQ